MLRHHLLFIYLTSDCLKTIDKQESIWVGIFEIYQICDSQRLDLGY